jgi:hypothetical protein
MPTLPPALKAGFAFPDSGYIFIISLPTILTVFR